MIVPGMLLAIVHSHKVFFWQSNAISTTEEKENRTVEMLLNLIVKLTS